MSSKDEGELSDGAQVPGPVRGQAGAYLETELLAEVFGPIPALFLGVGMLLGAGVYPWVGVVPVLGTGIAALAGAACFWIWRRRRRQSFSKGHIAERQVGRALEQAITAKGCAIAHNVMTVVDAGDIDHIIATPRRVWVVETKYRRLPKDAFGKALARLHVCRRKVEALFPPGTTVSACLILAYEDGGVRLERDGIEVFNNKTFRTDFLRRLREERDSSRLVDGQVATVVWRLSRGEEIDAGGVSVQRKDDARGSPDPGRTEKLRRHHPKAYERWTQEEDRELRDLHEAGWSVERLAEHFGRQRSAIRSRLRKA